MWNQEIKGLHPPKIALINPVVEVTCGAGRAMANAIKLRQVFCSFSDNGYSNEVGPAGFGGILSTNAVWRLRTLPVDSSSSQQFISCVKLCLREIASLV